MNSAVCPECHCQIRTTIPKGGDGSVDVFVRHSTKGAVRRMCLGSRCEVQRPPSALEKIQSYDSSGKPGRLSAFTPLTAAEVDLACEAYAGPGVHGEAIRAAVEAVLAKRAKLQPNAREVGRLVHEAVAVAVKPLTPAELAGLGIQVENGYGVETPRGELRAQVYGRAGPATREVGDGIVVRVRRITIWEKP